MSLRRIDPWAVVLLFVVEAIVSGLLIARLPDIKATNALSNAAFGLALFGIPTGTVLGFLLAPRTIGRFGLRRTSWLAAAALSIAALGPALAGGLPLLFAAFALFGLCLSHTEVMQNAIAGHLERVSGRRFMSRCHGGWSVGSIVGVLAGGVLAQAAVPVAAQQGVAALVAVMLALLLARILPTTPPRNVPDVVRSLTLRDRLPSAALVVLCVLPLGTLAVEGIVRDWGAIFLRDVLGAEPFASTLLFVSLSVSMAVVRLAGDGLLERFGDRGVVGASILCAGVGLLTVALAPSLAVALAGAAVTGFGVAVVYPVALSIAARRSDAPERDVAAVSFVCFVALMASPTVVGLLSQTFGLRTTLAAFAVASLIALLLLPTVPGRKGKKSE